MTGITRKISLSLIMAGVAAGGLIVAPLTAEAGCASGSAASPLLLSDPGCQAAANGANAIAVGLNATANGTAATAIGGAADSDHSAQANGVNSIAIGGSDSSHVYGATAQGLDSIAIGANAMATGQSSIALGVQALARPGSIAIGDSAGANSALGNQDNISIGKAAGQDVLGNKNVATGSQAGQIVRGNDNTATGSQAGKDVRGDDNAAYGAGAGLRVNGDSNTASGFRAGQGVNGNDNAAYGVDAGQFVTGDNNVALGKHAGSGLDEDFPLTMNNSVSIGANSVASQDNAVAIGAGVRTTRVGQVAIGDADATYTLAGVNSTASKAAQSGTTYLLTSDGAGNLATSNLNVGQLAGLDGRVTALEGGLSETRTEARQGIAAAIAMTTAPMPSAPGRTSWAANVGYFKGETAFGASLAHRIDLFDAPFAVTAGYAYGGSNSHAARIGLAGEF